MTGITAQVSIVSIFCGSGPYHSAWWRYYQGGL